MHLSLLADILHDEDCSCVIYSDGVVHRFRRRGVRDLYELYTHDRSILAGATIADKVVGKGAAALMAAGGVHCVYTDVISEPALELLRSAGVDITYGKCVPNIFNRAGTDLCPVEKLCNGCATAEECIPLIQQFIDQQTNPQ